MVTCSWPRCWNPGRRPWSGWRETSRRPPRLRHGSETPSPPAPIWTANGKHNRIRGRSEVIVFFESWVCHKNNNLKYTNTFLFWSCNLVPTSSVNILMFLFHALISICHFKFIKNKQSDFGLVLKQTNRCPVPILYGCNVSACDLMTLQRIHSTILEWTGYSDIVNPHTSSPVHPRLESLHRVQVDVPVVTPNCEHSPHDGGDPDAPSRRGQLGHILPTMHARVKTLHGAQGRIVVKPTYGTLPHTRN